MPYFGNEPAKSAIKVGDNTVLSATIANGVIINEDIKSDAAIAMSKTALVAGTGITLATNTLNVDAAQTQITSVGTIGTGVWNGTAVASAYLDADTAHLSGTQTFSGAKTFTSGQIYLDSSTDADLKLSAGGNGDSQIGFWDGSTNKAYFSWDRSDDRMELNTALDFEVQTNLIVTGDATVSSSDPTITIKRSNSSSYAGHLDFTNNADALGWQVGTNQVAGDGFEVNYGASNKFYVTTGGNVGIGTGGSNDRLLHVQGGANSNTGVIKIEGGQPWLEMQSGANTWAMYVGDAGGGDFYIRDGDPTGGVDYVTINAGDGNTVFAGRVQNSNPIFHAKVTNNSWSSNSRIVWNDVAINVGSCYNAGDGSFTAPVAGYYQFHFKLNHLDEISMYFKRSTNSGSSYADHIRFQNNTEDLDGYWNFSSSWIHYMVANEKVRMEIAGTAPAIDGDYWNYWSGYLIQ